MWKTILFILGLLYLLSPYDLLPDMFIGWGWIDDLVILGFLWRLFHLMKMKREAFQKYQQNSHGGYRYEYSKGSGGNSGFHSGTRAHETSRRWDPYKILEIERGASQDDIKHAYRRLAGKYHPDKLEHLGEEFKALGEKRFKEIQQAYQELRAR